MEQLLILLLVAIGSAVSGYFQNKKKREAAERELDPNAPPRPPSHEPPLVPHWPQSGQSWQEELRRLLQGETPGMPPKPAATKSPPPAPPVVRSKRVTAPPRVLREKSEGDLVRPTPLTQSGTNYDRAAQLSKRVEARMETINAQTRKHTAAGIGRRSPSAASVTVRHWTKDRQALREAFIASLIFGPPTGLQPRPQTTPWLETSV